MPELRPSAGNRGAASKTASGGLFFARKRKLTRPQLEQDAEIAFFQMEIGYRSAVALIIEVAEDADRLGYDILAKEIRRRLTIRLEGNG